MSKGCGPLSFSQPPVRQRGLQLKRLGGRFGGLEDSSLATL